MIHRGSGSVISQSDAAKSFEEKDKKDKKDKEPSDKDREKAEKEKAKEIIQQLTPVKKPEPVKTIEVKQEKVQPAQDQFAPIPMNATPAPVGE